MIRRWQGCKAASRSRNRARWWLTSVHGAEPRPRSASQRHVAWTLDLTCSSKARSINVAIGSEASNVWHCSKLRVSSLLMCRRRTIGSEQLPDVAFPARPDGIHPSMMKAVIGTASARQCQWPSTSTCSTLCLLELLTESEHCDQAIYT